MKKLLSIGMAAVLLLSSIQLYIPVQAAAGPAPDIQFVQADNNNPYSKQLMQGVSVPVSINYGSYVFIANEKFDIRDASTGTALSPAQANAMLSYNEQSKALTLSETAPAGQYTVFGNFIGKTATADVIESYPTKVDDPNSPGNPTTQNKNVMTKAVSAVDNTITSYGTVTLEVTLGETASGGLPTFEPVPNDASGFFSNYIGGSVTAGRGGSDASGRYITVTISRGGLPNIVLKLYPQQSHDALTNPDTSVTPAHSLIAAGTTYKIDFRTVKCQTPLIITVRTPDQTLADIQSAINDPLSTLNYVKLGAGDSLNWITQQFSLVNSTLVNGASTTVEWKWDPGANASNNGALELTKGATTTSVRIKPTEDDIIGTLVATITITNKGVTYPTSGTVVANVPITIKGTGKPAYVELGMSYKGTDAGEVISTTAPTNINNTPRNLDVNKNSTAPTEPFPPKQPYRFTATMYMGEKNAASEYATITVDPSTDTDAVQVFVNGNPLAYKWGDKIANPLPKGIGTADINVVAKKTGSVKLIYTFYTKGNGTVVQPYVTLTTPLITVQDSTPSTDATLKSLAAVSSDLSGDDSYKDYVIDLGFAPNKTVYTITVPNKAASIQLTPTTTDRNAEKEIKISVDGVPFPSTNSGDKSNAILLNDVGVQKKIELTVTAQDQISTSTYILYVTRDPKSRDANLAGLEVYREIDQSTNLIQSFLPAITTYNIDVPYSTEKVKVVANKSDRGATVTIDPPLTRAGFFGAESLVPLKNYVAGDRNITTITVTVTPEDGANFAKTYTINVHRMDPSDNTYVSKMEVTDPAGKAIPFTDGQVFVKTEKEYRMEVPYSQGYVMLTSAADDPNAQFVEITANGKTEKFEASKLKPVKVTIPDELAGGAEMQVKIVVTAESGKLTEPPYVIGIKRLSPNDDATLKSMEITDNAGKAVETFSFNSETLAYTFTVPYETDRIRITPKVNAVTSKVTIDGYTLSDNRPSQSVDLPVGSVKKIEVIVQAESGKKQTYTLNVTRGAPSSEARLKSLSLTGASALKPLFVPATTSYSADVTAGAKGVTVIAVTAHPSATLKINGKAAVSGTASPLIEPLEVKSDITVEVTAQDGKTRKVYTIRITNQNLIEKTNNADLRSLTVSEGAMSPKFQASTSTYEVAVSDSTDYVDIVPKTADPYATVKVFNGRKEIGDQSGNFSEAIANGETNFTIEVTSSDTTKKKQYFVNVFRNEDDKGGVLTPITADKIDFNAPSPIVVDISKYSVIAADVFNKLKEKPDTTIVFQGNDYSLQFKGADIKTVVPYTNTYDLGFSFTSPNEGEILDELYSHRGNEKIDPVFVYFKHHGALPAPATLILSLGSKYKNKTMYWNYYNDERERIDYYGYVKTNSRGTFSVPITHFSDYLVTTSGINGAENKVGTESGFSSENLGSLSGGKVNPGTGAQPMEEANWL